MSLDKNQDVRDLYPRIYDTGLIEPSLLAINDDFAKGSLLSTFGFYSLFGREDTDWIEEVDPHNSYRINSFGCRDPEYVGPVDLIAAGCSQTFGQGVPEEWRWSSILGKKLNMSVATIAVPGWSIMGAVNSTMHYIKTYGKPKAVALYLPDLFRFDYIRNPEIFVDLKDEDDVEGNDTGYRVDIGHSSHVGRYPKLSKRPHIVSEVVNPETTAFLNGQVLKFFVEYCKEAKIEIVWSTWEGSFQELVDYLKNLDFKSESDIRTAKADFSDYVEIDYKHDGPEGLEEFSLKSCHKEEKEGLDSDTLKYYDCGSDVDRHIGIHVHMHVADAFYKRLHRLVA